MSDAPLAARVESLAASIEPAGPLGELVRTVRRVFLDELVFESAALDAMLGAIRTRTELPPALAIALRDELARNLAACDAQRLAGRPIGFDRIDVLRRIHGLIVRLDGLAAMSDPRVRARGLRSLRFLVTDLDRPHGDMTPKDIATLRIEAEVAACQALVRLALTETSTPARRRRLLDAAKRTLLDVEATYPMRREQLLPGRHAVVREIVALERALAAGLDPHVAWTHQARSAHARRDIGALVNVLVAMDAATRGADDPRSPHVIRALERLKKATSTAAPRQDADARAFADAYGEKATSALIEAFREPTGRAGGPAVDRTGLDRVVHAIVNVAGAFELGSGDRIAPRAITIERAVVVSHPEQTMRVEPATSVADLPNAFLDDPRTSLLDLASGRLLTRRYVRLESRKVVRPTRTAVARYFLLDGSGSMIEPPVIHRAGVRDALALAELAEIVKQESTGPRDYRTVFFYRYFAKVPEPITRVADAATATTAMQRIVREIRSGGTDIEAALIAGFEDIRAAVADDPELVEAKLVLITDGKAPVSAAALDAARRGLDGVPVQLSVIALGEQNPELQAIVAAQRAAGEQAFYQFLDDAEMRALLDPSTSAADHAFDPEALRALAHDSHAALRDELGGILDEIAAIERATTATQLAEARLDAEAFADAAMEIDFLPGPSLSGHLAREEHLERDLRALDARFDRWFPSVPAESVASVRTDTDHRAEVVVRAIGEVLEVLGSDPVELASGAIGLLETMLADAGLGALDYARVVRAPSDELRLALLGLRVRVREPAPATTPP